MLTCKPLADRKGGVSQGHRLVYIYHISRSLVTMHQSVLGRQKILAALMASSQGVVSVVTDGLLFQRDDFFRNACTLPASAGAFFQRAEYLAGLS